MADAVIRLKLTGAGPGTLAAFQRQLERPQALLRLYGRAAASEAQRSFDRQGLNAPNEWPRRYPSQEPPYVNIAGCIQDLAKGPAIKNHRFDARPAVIDTGHLRRSLAGGGAVQIVGTYAVEVGTTVPYASLQQFGGDVEIPITDTVKTNLRAWYFEQKGKMARASIGGRKFSYGKGKAKREPLHPVTAKAWLAGVMRKLGPLLHMKIWTQTVIARPFVGMNEDLRATLVRLTVDFFAGKGVAA